MISEVLQTVNVQSELQSLHHPNVNGLGGPKHQEIVGLFQLSFLVIPKLFIIKFKL